MSKKDDTIKKNIIVRYSAMFLLFFVILSSYFTKIIIAISSYVIYFLFNLFYDLELIILNNVDGVIGRLMFYNSFSFDVIEVCIGISAYILFVFLLFSMNIELKKIFSLLIKSSITFFAFNIIRVVILIYIGLNFSSSLFDAMHLLFYEILVGAIAALIILFFLRREKVAGSYPVYNDIRFLLLDVKRNFYKKK